MFHRYQKVTGTDQHVAVVKRLEFAAVSRSANRNRMIVRPANLIKLQRKEPQGRFRKPQEGNHGKLTKAKGSLTLVDLRRSKLFDPTFSLNLRTQTPKTRPEVALPTPTIKQLTSCNKDGT
jgi:hypothetical protein